MIKILKKLDIQFLNEEEEKEVITWTLYSTQISIGLYVKSTRYIISYQNQDMEEEEQQGIFETEQEAINAFYGSL